MTIEPTSVGYQARHATQYFLIRDAPPMVLEVETLFVGYSYIPASGVPDVFIPSYVIIPIGLAVLTEEGREVVV